MEREREKARGKAGFEEEGRTRVGAERKGGKERWKRGKKESKGGKEERDTTTDSQISGTTTIFGTSSQLPEPIRTTEKFFTFSAT